MSQEEIDARRKAEKPATWRIGREGNSHGKFHWMGPWRGVRDAFVDRDWSNPWTGMQVMKEIGQDFRQTGRDLKDIKDFALDPMSETDYSYDDYGNPVLKKGYSWDPNHKEKIGYFAYGPSGEIEYYDKGYYKNDQGQVMLDPSAEDLFQQETTDYNPFWQRKENGSIDFGKSLNPKTATDRAKLWGLGGLMFTPGVGDLMAWNMDGELYDQKQRPTGGYTFDKEGNVVEEMEDYNPRTAGNALISGLSYVPLLGLSAAQIAGLKRLKNARKSKIQRMKESKTAKRLKSSRVGQHLNKKNRRRYYAAAGGAGLIYNAGKHAANEE